MDEALPQDVVKRLTISLLSNGSVTVNGPINDTAACYGLLELAKDAVRVHAFQNVNVKDQPAIQVAGEIPKSPPPSFR